MLNFVMYHKLRNFESQMQIADQCAPCSIASNTENLLLHALQFQNIDVCRRLPGREDISHYGPN
jgi:hypothetical protein